MKTKPRKKSKNSKKILFFVLFLALTSATVYFGINSQTKTSENSNYESRKTIQISYLDRSSSKESRLVKVLPLEDGFIAVGSSYSSKEKLFDIYLTKFG